VKMADLGFSASGGRIFDKKKGGVA